MNSNERGQMILIGGLVLALVLVSLALIVNSIIFTENLATRGATGDTQQAGMSHRPVVSGTAGAITYVNTHHNASNDTLTRNLTAMLEDWNAMRARHYTTNGVHTDIRLETPHNGTQIMQTDDTRNFTSGGSNSGKGNWTLVSDTSDTRNFQMNVSKQDLLNSSLSDVNFILDNSFYVEVTNDTGHSWKMYVFYNVTEDGVIVFDEHPTEDVSGTLTDYCVGKGDWVTIDLIRGQVNGRDCQFLTYANLSGTHTIQYHNADDTNVLDLLTAKRARGTYSLYVNTTSVDDTVYYDPSQGKSPFTTAAIYSARISTRYQDATVTVEREVEVVPGVEAG